MFFGNRPLVRGIACFLLLETLTSLLAPSIGWAIMGPGQPEFTSYEASSSPDLVDLTTGNLTYNIPVLDVPGPDRSFSLPLTYRAGIELEQEASWVGLGWSLNAGAIARSLNGYPDDASGELSQHTYNQQITRGWNGGVPGVLELGWDANTGHHGSASLIGLIGLGWSGGNISSGELVGIHADSKGVSVDPIAMASAAVTIATLGAASSVSAVAAVAAKQIGTDVVSAVATSVLLGKASSTGGALGEPTVKEKKGFLHTNYWVFYNDERKEFMYGSLYFDRMSQSVKNQSPRDNPSPNVHQGSLATGGTQSPEFATSATRNGGGSFQSSPAADLYQYNAPGSDHWSSNKNPLSIAHDDFSVMGGSVSGNIRPYRLEVGSLAFPYKGLERHNKFAAVPYLSDYKVPFRYENSISNGYDYHEFTPSAATTSERTGVVAVEQPYPSKGVLVLKDPKTYVYGGNALTDRTAPARKGIVNQFSASSGVRERKFVQGKNVQWFSNDEILSMYSASPDGPGDGSFLEANRPTPAWVAGEPVFTGNYTTCPDVPYDPYSQEPACQPEPIYEPGPDQQLNNPWRLTLPGKGVGAFAVTSEDGTTYHYSLPVYHYVQFSRSRQLVAPAGAQTAGVSTQTMGSRTRERGGYATTWLLTAITSSDYVDRGGEHGGGNGTVDPSDWGGWVRFDYGKFSSAYKWRQPYSGESYSEDSFNDVSFAEGIKETYYLNSITTRTHTALFVKSLRNDGRGHFQATEPSNLGIDETHPASSLRLDEIVLLNNDDAAKLKTEDGVRLTGDSGPVIPALSVNTANNNANQDWRELGRYDSYKEVLDQHDLNADGRVRAFINQRALKRVVFNYSYRLCNYAPNSFAATFPVPSLDGNNFICTRTGKLTLESLSTYGPANTKLTPDFKFAYDHNPWYDKASWDGFGMYKSGVSLNTNQAPKKSHQVSADFATATRDASAWSLTEITNPLGGKTRFMYERDQYAKVSEYPLEQTANLSNTDGSNIFTTDVPNAADYLRVGQTLVVTYSYAYECTYPTNTDDRGEPCSNCTTTSTSTCTTSANLTITDISGSVVTVDPSNIPTGPDPSCGPSQNLPPGATCSGVGFINAGATLSRPLNKNGGDLRVAAIATVDEMGRANQVLYRYTTSLPTGATSSGVISKEPVFVERQARPFDKLFDYPGTSVLYGKVTVLRGAFRANAATDYDVREEYTFQTPSSTMIQSSSQNGGGVLAQSEDSKDPHNDDKKGFRALDTYNNVTTVNLSSIGQPISIKKFNRRGELEAQTAFEYSNTIPNPDGIAGQGVYTEGAMTHELLDNVYYRVNRSTKKYLPTVLVGTTTTTNGISSRAHKDKFDFYTGMVVESSFRNYLNELYRSKIVPAYTLPNYAAMGPASENLSNRNMLGQEAASYTYKVRSNGTQAVVAANVQTWKDTWASYRGYNATTDSYTDQSDDPRPIWRLHESYVWSSPRLNPDGTYADGDFTPFDWARLPLSGQPKGWLKAGEFTRYDHYSKPVESTDVNGQYSSSKLGYNQAQRLVNAVNARYTEVAYSGAEDQVDQGNGVVHFSGEVRDGGRRSAQYHHTGLYSTKLMPQELGFTYKALLGSEVRGGRKYRLSCWVHSNDVGQGAQLYAQADGVQLGYAFIGSPTTKQAGAWRLLNLLVDVPATGTQLTFGCRNTGSQPVYVDDFRFQPVEGPATAYVYDPHTAQLTHVLDNENLYTRFEYDAAGKMMRAYKEVLTPIGTGNPSAERIVKEYAYNYARMTEANWLPTGVTSWVQGTGGPTTQRQREEKDINPRSVTYNTARMVADGFYPNCAPKPIVCESLYDPQTGRVVVMRRRLMNGCEEALDLGWSCIAENSNGIVVYRIKHDWVWDSTNEKFDTDSFYSSEGCSSSRTSSSLHLPSKTVK
ncbi:MAG TPA: hypothetical protein VF629_06280 [Hymenobacter sp.]|jgi:hypothetical protein|uniref:hypothetical protein n=1 Tax=Hymenobacter sp. TaxID=1898978 RepID=UPI002ED8ACD5